MVIDFEQRRFSIGEYLRMADSGIFGPEERVELLDGIVVSVPPADPEEASVVSDLFSLLAKRIVDRVTLRCRSGVALGTSSLPEPAIGLFVRVAARYRERYPGERDALALIEVSRSRLDFDRGPKLRLYAQSRIPEYWIVDLHGERLEVFRRPRDIGFDVRECYVKGESVSLISVPDEVFSVSDLLRPEG